MGAPKFAQAPVPYSSNFRSDIVVTIGTIIHVKKMWSRAQRKVIITLGEEEG